MRRLTMLVSLLLLAVSCGDDGGSGTDPAAEAAPPELSVVDVEDRVEQRFDIIGGPDWMAEEDGSLWVKVDDGRVVRLDPATNEVAAEIQAGSNREICQGIGAGDGAVWTCDEQSLVRIDPSTNEVAATVAVDKAYDSGQLPVAFDHVWALAGDGSGLVGVRDDAVDLEFDLGVRCVEITAAADALWAACIEDGTAIRIDPDSGEVTAQVEGLEGARTISADGEDVWVGHSTGVTRIDATTAEAVGVADIAASDGSGLFASDGSVWVRTPGSLRRIDRDFAVVEEIAIPEPSGGSVRLAFGSIWTSAYDDAVIYRLTLS